MTKFEQYLEAIRKQKTVKEEAEVVENIEESSSKNNKSEIINNKRNK